MIEGSKIRALIVDDELHTRCSLRRFLGRYQEMELVGECSDGYQAIAAIRQHSPDLVFLDVKMPEIDGFTVLERVSAQQPAPLVIFVSGYPEYACQAFDVDAVDFLHKPFDRKRFDIALQKAKRDLAAGRSDEVNQRLLALLEKLSAEPHCAERLLVKAKECAFFLETDEIDWIKADGKYVQLHVGRESYELREALCSLEARLDPKQFRRISRYIIVNIDRVKKIIPWIGGHRIILKDGQKLDMSRDCRKNFMNP